MNREELIKLAEERRAQVSAQLEVCNFNAGIRKIKENEHDFLREVVSALRAQQTPAKVDRSRWKGCKMCSSPRLRILEQLGCQYCEYCGCPLTGKAWAELERKIF